MEGVTKRKRLNKLFRKATSVIGAEQDAVVSAADKLNKLLSIMDNSRHPVRDGGREALAILPALGHQTF